MPRETKARLGLDGERSWVVLSEWNEFAWPGPDLRMTPAGDAKTIAYGYLPARFFGRMQAEFAAIATAGRSRKVWRGE
jgi:hypothetical protein